MIEQYLPQTNESATVSQNFSLHQLNTANKTTDRWSLEIYNLRTRSENVAIKRSKCRGWNLLVAEVGMNSVGSY